MTQSCSTCTKRNLSTFQLAKQSQSKDKHLVYGYIRKENQLFDVPQSIYAVCFWHYCHLDDIEIFPAINETFGLNQTTYNEIKIKDVKHHYISVQTDVDKLSVLCRLYKSLATTKSIIYLTRSKHAVTLAEKMKDKNINVLSLHDARYNMSKVWEKFRGDWNGALIATDILSSRAFVGGPYVPLIINYDLPLTDLYLNRILTHMTADKSERSVKAFYVINLVNKQEKQKLKDIEKIYNIKILDVPSMFHIF
eukprot:52455_1